MQEGQREGSDLLALQLPCCTSTATLQEFVKCIYDGGTMEMRPEMLLEMIQLADAIQVCQWHPFSFPITKHVGIVPASGAAAIVRHNLPSGMERACCCILDATASEVRGQRPGPGTIHAYLPRPK